MYDFGVLVFLSSIAVGLANLTNSSVFCFQCNPKMNARNCAEPAKTLTPSNCSVQGSEFATACYSEFLIYRNLSGNSQTSNKTGLYRGCYSYRIGSRTQFDYCSVPPGRNVTRQYCETCNSSRCNSETFKNVDGLRIRIPRIRIRGGSDSKAISIIHFTLIFTIGLFISDIVKRE